MSSLVFGAAEARRVAEHAAKSSADVLLVHDQGVYLMSGAQPRDIVKDDHSFCAYADGCNPDKDADFWEAGRDLVGGDDFGEHLPWAKDILRLLDAGATKIVVRLSEKSIKLAARYPRRKSAAKGGQQ